jgi:hypothetical protein
MQVGQTTLQTKLVCVVGDSRTYDNPAGTSRCGAAQRRDGRSLEKTRILGETSVGGVKQFSSNTAACFTASQPTELDGCLFRVPKEKLLKPVLLARWTAEVEGSPRTLFLFRLG